MKLAIARSKKDRTDRVVLEFRISVFAAAVQTVFCCNVTSIS